ncbi:hypothetical protein ACKZDW_18525 [Ralstonia syzygii subsp. celebesensis]
MFLDYQSRGVDKVGATIDMMQSIFSKDAKFQELRAKLRATDKNDKEGQRQILEAMSAQVQGTAVGKVFHNQQSLMAFLGVMNNQQYTNDVLGKVNAQYGLPADRSEIATSFQGIADTSDFKVEQAKEDAAVAQKSAMDSLTPAIGKAAEAFADLAQSTHSWSAPPRWPRRRLGAGGRRRVGYGCDGRARCGRRSNRPRGRLGDGQCRWPGRDEGRQGRRHRGCRRPGGRLRPGESLWRRVRNFPLRLQRAQRCRNGCDGG